MQKWQVTFPRIADGGYTPDPAILSEVIYILKYLQIDLMMFVRTRQSWVKNINIFTQTLEGVFLVATGDPYLQSR